ncbi:MAG: kinase [Peptococcaceae bacterium]|jgi:L-threonine kinase|nr:kinase [Peptococcaceae bacterium]
MQATVFAPATCGEIVQGTFNDINMHITCPINYYSKVTACRKGSPGVNIYPENRYKAQRASELTLEYLNVNAGMEIIIESDIPVGKGMASSTADIAASAQATALALGHYLSPHVISEIALAIEPSDGLFYPGIVAFDHVRGRYYQHLGNSVDLTIIAFDYGGEIDTIAFNKRPDLPKKNRDKEHIIRKAYSLVKQGLKGNNLKLIGEGASLSALANQTIIYKPYLEEIIEMATKMGAYGVNTAHSGTLIGIFTKSQSPLSNSLTEEILKHFPFLELRGKFSLVNGGFAKEIRTKAAGEANP